MTEFGGVGFAILVPEVALEAKLEITNLDAELEVELEVEPEAEFEAELEAELEAENEVLLVELVALVLV